MAWMVSLGLSLKENSSIIYQYLTQFVLFMKNKTFVLALCLALNSIPFHSLVADPVLNKTQEDAKIIVRNRVLANINGKPITTYDVMKKMDIVFYREFPEYITIVPARFQFYQANWRSILDDLINKELVLADAQEHKIEVSSGDIRQEMESSFGPNIIENLDKVGMSFDEAAKIIESELLIRRIVGGRVHAKAMRIVTPNKVREAYDQYARNPKNATQTEWRYQVVNVNDRNSKKAEEAATEAYRLITQENVPLDQVAAKLKEANVLGAKTKISISEEIANNEGELSESYKKILLPLGPQSVSQPTAQKSRTTRAMVYRIFVVHDRKEGGVPPFVEMENKIRERLLNEFVDKETTVYLNKLRQHYRVRQSDIDANIPSTYQPFGLQGS